MLNIFDDIDPDMPAQQPAQQQTFTAQDVSRLVQMELQNQSLKTEIAGKKNQLKFLQEKISNGDLHNGAGYTTAEGKYDLFAHNRDRQEVTKLEGQIRELESQLAGGGNSQFSQQQNPAPADSNLVARVKRIAMKVASDNAPFTTATSLPNVKRRFEAGVNRIQWQNFASHTDDGLEQMLDATWVHAIGEEQREGLRAQSGSRLSAQSGQKPESTDPLAGKTESQLIFLKNGGEPRLKNWQPGQAIPPLEGRA